METVQAKILYENIEENMETAFEDSDKGFDPTAYDASNVEDGTVEEYQ